VCAQLGEPLLQRQRALAGLVPWMPLGAWHGTAVRWARARPAQSAVAAGSVAVLAAAAVVVGMMGAPAGSGRTQPSSASASPGAGASHPSSPSSSGGASLTAKGEPVLPVADDLVALVGQRVTARGVRVLSVPADEGFWVGDHDARVWVQLSTSGESPVRIRAGQRLSFVGDVVRHDDEFARRVGATGRDDARTLTREGAHLAVDDCAVRVDSQP